MRTYALLLTAAVTLAGCEGREAKLDRLKRDESIARLTILSYERQIDSIMAVHEAELDSLLRRTDGSYSDRVYHLTGDLSQKRRDAENRLDLVQADIRKLLR